MACGALLIHVGRDYSPHCNAIHLSRVDATGAPKRQKRRALPARGFPRPRPLYSLLASEKSEPQRASLAVSGAL